MSLPRARIPERCYLITTRCSERRFLMRPDRETNNAFIYCMAPAARKSGNGSQTSSAVPVTVTGLTDATSVTVGGDFACALKSDGTVWCWVGNWTGQLGDGTGNTRVAPVQVQF